MALPNKLMIILSLFAALSKADFCVSGSVSNSIFNGNYAQEGTDANGNTYYNKTSDCGSTEYLYQYKSDSNYYFQFSYNVGTGSYYIKCPTPNIASPKDCPAGTWLSAGNTESSIVVGNGCPTVVPEMSCSNILLENSGDPTCDGLFTKIDNNLYSRELSSNCGASGGIQYWYYNEAYKLYECGNADKRDACQTGTTYYSKRSTDTAFGTITEGQTDVSISDLSATLSCGVEQEDEVMTCDNIQVTGSNYCNGVFVKVTDNVYTTDDNSKYWFQYAYNIYSSAYGKMMCYTSNQNSECSPYRLTGDMAKNKGLPQFIDGTALVKLESTTATFRCDVPAPAPSPISENDVCLDSPYGQLGGIYELTGQMKDNKPIYKYKCGNLWLVYYEYFNKYYLNLNDGSNNPSYYANCDMAGKDSVTECEFDRYVTSVSFAGGACSNCASAQALPSYITPSEVTESMSIWTQIKQSLNTETGMIIIMLALVGVCGWSIGLFVCCMKGKDTSYKKAKIYIDEAI